MFWSIDSIHHGTLLHLLTRRFRDSRLMRLFEQVIRGYQTSPGRGLPIGNLLSQHFANFYLGLLDHYLKKECRVSALVSFTKAADAVGFRRLFIQRRRVSSEGAPTACIAAAAGTTTPRTRGRRTGTGTTPTTGTTTLASACFSP